MSTPLRRSTSSFLREWKRNMVTRGIWWLVLFPPFFFFLFLDGLPMWVPSITAAVWVVALSCWAWKVAWGYDERQRPPPPTPEQVWEARFQKVATSTEGLPQGLTLKSFCEEYDENALKQAMHLLHQMPPGARHLRAALQEML